MAPKVSDSSLALLAFVALAFSLLEARTFWSPSKTSSGSIDPSAALHMKSSLEFREETWADLSYLDAETAWACTELLPKLTPSIQIEVKYLASKDARFEM